MLKAFLCVSVFLIAIAPISPCQADEVKGDNKPAESQAAPAALPTLKDLPAKEVDGVKLAEIEANVVAYTNQERARYGLPPLKVDKELMTTAREHAAWMTENQTMVHTSQPVAENIAMGQPSSGDVVQAWMNSSGHRANILNAGHGRIGVAAFRTVGGVIYWCQQFRE